MKPCYKIRASSLIETVIAITIITICSLIAILVYSRIVGQTPPIKKYNWSMEVTKVMEEAFLRNDFASFKREYKNYSVEGRLSKNNEIRGLNTIEFLVISQNDTVIIPMMLYKPDSDED